MTPTLFQKPAPAVRSLESPGWALPLVLGCTLFASACGGGSPTGARAEASPQQSTQGLASPAPGQSRRGRIYDVSIQVPATGDTAVFTVFEPGLLEGGQRYPLVLHSHGFSQSRTTSKDCPACASGLDEDLGLLVDNGYGVISIDQRGHGESSGDIRLMDPDFEGKNLLAILDWAEANLDWLARGPRVDGSDPDNLIVGAVGGSYGGGYQLLLNAIDPQRRLDAIVPEITWYSLRYALAPNGVLRSTYALGLYAAGQSSGSGVDRAHYDPYVDQFLLQAIQANRLPPGAENFLGYHGSNYFCEGQAIASNGPGRVPERAPVRPPAVHALFFQGMRDPIFGFDQAYWNAQCLRASGGDVRLLSYQAGHNFITPFLDLGGQLNQPPGHFTNDDCGDLDVHDATLAFFDEHLKGIAGAAQSVPRNCLSLSAGDAVNVDEVTAGQNGTAFAVPATTVIAGVPDVPVAVELMTIGAGGDVLAGLPQLQVSVAPLFAGTPGEPILFAGVGHMRANASGVWDLVDNQVSPLRGTGAFDLALVGGAERLDPGDKIGLLFYGGHQQFAVSGSLNAAAPTIMPVVVRGRVWLPLLGPQP